MRRPIDVLHLAVDGHVLCVERHLRPWRVGVRVKGTESILEMGAGCADEISVGDHVTLVGGPADGDL